jgi:hypothetical protein
MFYQGSSRFTAVSKNHGKTEIRRPKPEFRKQANAVSIGLELNFATALTNPQFCSVAAQRKLYGNRSVAKRGKSAGGMSSGAW